MAGPSGRTVRDPRRANRTAVLQRPDFFARGGRRPEPPAETPRPAWRAALEERAAH